MKNVLLIAPSCADSNELVCSAAALTHRGFCKVLNSRAAYERLFRGLPEFDVLVVDVARDIHPMAILESISACENVPPVIVITDLEEEDMRNVVRRHGATACIGKPLTVKRLAEVIEKVAAEGVPTQSHVTAGNPRFANVS